MDSEHPLARFIWVVGAVAAWLVEAVFFVTGLLLPFAIFCAGALLAYYNGVGWFVYFAVLGSLCATDLWPELQSLAEDLAFWRRW